LVPHCLACVTVKYYRRLCNFHYEGSGIYLLWAFIVNLGVPFCRGVVLPVQFLKILVCSCLALHGGALLGFLFVIKMLTRLLGYPPNYRRPRPSLFTCLFHFWFLGKFSEVMSHRSMTGSRNNSTCLVKLYPRNSLSALFRFNFKSCIPRLMSWGGRVLIAIVKI
jgi:hypothetical protein